MKIANRVAASTGLAAFLCAAFWMASVGTGQTVPQPARNDTISPAKAREEVDKIVKELRDARALAVKIDDKRLRDQIEQALGRAELRARNLSDDLIRTRPAQLLPMLSPAEYDKLLVNLKKESFDQGKLGFIENFASIKPLSCQQAAGFLKCFSFDDLRIKAASALFPKLSDPQNFTEVLDTFTFENNKAAVKKAVGLK